MNRLVLLIAVISLFAGLAHVVNGAAPRSFMWLVGDPHIYSVKKGYEICNIKELMNCFSIGSKVSVICSGTPVDPTVANASMYILILPIHNRQLINS